MVSYTPSPQSDEYCFKHGNAQSVCSGAATPSPLSQNALLECGDILQNMEILNKSQELKTLHIAHQTNVLLLFCMNKAILSIVLQDFCFISKHKKFPFLSCP